MQNLRCPAIERKPPWMSWRLWPLPELAEFLETPLAELADRLDPVRDVCRKKSRNPLCRHERAMELICEQYEGGGNAS